MLQTRRVLLFLAVTAASTLSAQARGQTSPTGAQPGKTPVQYANGLVGTAPLDKQIYIGNAPPPGEQLYSGYTSPGAKLPHSSTDIAPINANLPFTYPAGVPASYYYPNPTMFGFSAGGPDGPTIMPVVGDWSVPPARKPSIYDKAKEVSSPGYYSAYLDSFQTTAEMTATPWTGLFRFTFPATEKAHVLLDLGQRGGQVEIVDNHTVRGQAQTHPGKPQGDEPGDPYFVAEFSRPFARSGTFRQLPPTKLGRDLLGDKDVMPGGTTIAGPYAGAYLDFATTAGEQVLVKIAHGGTYADAEQKLQHESPGWDFAAIKQKAEAAWAQKLNLIQIQGGTEHDKMFFYSCLLHSLDSPRLIASKGEQFTALDGTTKTAAHDRYGPVPFWDTGRNQIVLLTLLEPQLKENILRSELDMARESGYMGTSFHGDNAVFMYLGDWERGLQFDWASVYPYLRKNAIDAKGPRGYLAEYLAQGWISDFIPPGNPSPPYAGGKAGAATTLEYAWDDHAMALFAKKLGKDDDAAMFLKRAQNYKNVFDPSIGFVRGRTADGKWIAPFDPREPYYNFMMKEASGWSTLWLVPHDVQGLINLLGGRDAFNAKLDQFFTTPYHPKGICRDCEGMVGQYVQGNQPDQQAAYYYDWGGQPWKTQQLARRIMHQLYGSDSTGYAFPGMDDQGSTSSWYVMSAMGFYPVDPSSPNYILGSPLFTDAKMQIGGGKTFEIQALHNSDQNIYIQSATLNGQPWNKPWFSHSDIVNGGKLVLTMGPTPNKQWGSAASAAPPSMSVPN